MTCQKFLPDVWPRYQPCQQQCAHEFLMKTFEVLESTSSVADTFTFHNQVTGKSRLLNLFVFLFFSNRCKLVALCLANAKSCNQ